jgi:coenzyme PQQ precursor peptide PqqA
MAPKTRQALESIPIRVGRHVAGVRPLNRETPVMTKKVWTAPKVATTTVSMEVTMYLPAQV